MATSCIIIGGKGFVGSAIVKAAQQQGLDVLAVDIDNYEDAKDSEAEWLINANGNSKKFLGAKDPCLEFDLSVRTVMNSLHDFNYKRYIHLSTMDVYPEKSDPNLNRETAEIDRSRLAPYGVHKRMAEMLVQYYAEDWLIFRMAGFVGSGLKKNSVYDMLSGGKLYVNPASRYQYINTLDLGRAILTMAGRNISKELFNIAGTGTIPLTDVAEMIGYDLSQCDTTLPVDHCEVNTEKIRSQIDLPNTADTVKAFITDVQSGKEPLT